MTMRTLPRLALIDRLGLGRPVFGPMVVDEVTRSCSVQVARIRQK